jgi:RNA-splicing ligase RtcB
MDRAMAEVLRFIGCGTETRRINCHHNFTQPEVHGGNELWVTRKGAIRADKGDLGVIPGSMGTRSYIVRGKGNAASWLSCSHGAGRRHSRSRARKLYTSADLAKSMAGKVWLAKRADALVDEIPAAYKDIDQVMADQCDLVEVLHTLRQVLNYKGT